MPASQQQLKLADRADRRKPDEGKVERNLAANPTQSGEFSRRITTIQEGKRQPIYAANPIGNPSPSSTLLVERYDLQSVPWQSHQATEQLLMLCLKPGIVRYSLEGDAVRRVSLSAGRVGFDPRGREKYLSHDGPLSALWVRISDSAFAEAAEGAVQGGQLEVVAPASLIDRRLEGLLYSLEAERRAGFPSGALFVDAVEVALATLLVMSFAVPSTRPRIEAAKPRKSGSGSHSLPPRLLQRVLNRMDLLDPALSLHTLAAEAGYSRRHFHRMFKSSTGYSPHQYLLHLRLKRAQELIRKSGISLIDVAAACGFSSHTHMSKAFRKLLGVTPGEYRRSC